MNDLSWGREGEQALRDSTPSESLCRRGARCRGKGGTATTRAHVARWRAASCVDTNEAVPRLARHRSRSVRCTTERPRTFANSEGLRMSYDLTSTPHRCTLVRVGGMAAFPVAGPGLPHVAGVHEFGGGSPQARAGEGLQVPPRRRSCRTDSGRRSGWRRGHGRPSGRAVRLHPREATPLFWRRTRALRSGSSYWPPWCWRWKWSRVSASCPWSP